MTQVGFTYQKKQYQKKVSRLQSLLDVSVGYPQWEKYNAEMDALLAEFREFMMVPEEPEKEQKESMK